MPAVFGSVESAFLLVPPRCAVYVYPMKRILAAVAVFVVAVAVASLVYLGYSGRSTAQVNSLKLLAASRAYAESFRSRGMTVPATVDVKELISRGLVTEADVSGFAGMEVTINLLADNSDPKSVLILARLPDGREFVTLTDGSVHPIVKK